MNAKQRWFSVLFLLFALAVPKSHAVIIEGTFKGEVIFFTDVWNRYWGEDILGTPVTGSFWYDTDRAHMNPIEEDWTHYEGGNWMDFTFNIAGRTLRVLDIYPEGYVPADFNWMTVLNRETSEFLDEYEYLHLSHSSLLGNKWEGDFNSRQAHLDFSTSTESFLNGIEIIQEIDWKKADNPNYDAIAYYITNGRKDGIEFSSYTYVGLSELKMGIKKDVSVPEPTTLLLLALGFAAIFWQRNYQNKRKCD